jgi:N4-gp56 family major capsid protein
MAATVTTLTSNITAPINFVLMKQLLNAARKKLPYFNGTLPGSLEKSQGAASVKWRRIENLATATTALGEVTGTAAAFLGRNAVQPVVTDITVAIAKYGNLILLTEEVDFFNVNSRSVELADTMGANAGESLNVLIRNEFSNASIVRRSGGQTTDSSIAAAITLNDIKFAVNTLNRNSAMKFTSMGTGSHNYSTYPIRESYLGVAHVDVEEDIRVLTGFIPVEQYGGYTETYPFEFGAVGGVRFCSTEIAPVSTLTTSLVSAAGLRGNAAFTRDLYSTFIYGKEAIGTIGLGNQHATTSYEMYDPKKPPAVELITKKPGSSGIYDPFNEMGSLAWKAWYAGKILNADWLVNVKTGASALL